MREIIFRGKDYKGKWAYGSLVEHKIITSNGMISSYNILYQDENDWGSFSEIKQCSIEKETIGQYTGLTDKNGKKIYEGDIIKDDDECFLVVQWSGAGYFELRIYDAEDDYNNYLSPIWEYNLENMEIIGNIWDNPEMIKENEDE